MRRKLIHGGAIALLAIMTTVFAPTGAAQAAPDCDVPVPPPICNEEPDPDPGPVDRPARGALDEATYVGNAVHVRGWGSDADSGGAPILVDIWIDNAFAKTLTANVYRSDVGSHGFEADVPVGLGTHQVCAWAISVVPSGANNPGNPQLGCRSITATMAAPTNVQWTAPGADRKSTFTFTDNSVEESRFDIVINHQAPAQTRNWRCQCWTTYWTTRSFTIYAPAGAGAGSIVTYTSMPPANVCGVAVRAVQGSFISSLTWAPGYSCP